MQSVDLNSDIGEGYSVYTCGDDDAMLSIVTSANVAFGVHAGDPEIMGRTFSRALGLGVAIAHPGFPDRWGFGRRRIPFTNGEIERLLAYQLGAACALACYAGHGIGYVKPHGALANIAAEDRDVADALARSVRAVARKLPLLAIAMTQQVAAGVAAGLDVYQEIFADRGYAESGRLIPRGKAGSMIHDAETAAARALIIIQEWAIVTVSGKRLPTSIRSICVHGDTSAAVETARRVREAVEGAGVAVCAFTAK